MGLCLFELFPSVQELVAFLVHRAPILIRFRGISCQLPQQSRPLLVEQLRTLVRSSPQAHEVRDAKIQHENFLRDARRALSPHELVQRALDLAVLPFSLVLHFSDGCGFFVGRHIYEARDRQL